MPNPFFPDALMYGNYWPCEKIGGTGNWHCIISDVQWQFLLCRGII